MAQLIEPDGTFGEIVTIEFAQEYCTKHPGWTWQYYHGD